MINFVAAFGLMLVLEGVLYALFPNFMRQAMEAMLSMEEVQIRVAAVGTAGLGLLIVWLAMP